MEILEGKLLRFSGSDQKIHVKKEKKSRSPRGSTAGRTVFHCFTIGLIDGVHASNMRRVRDNQLFNPSEAVISLNTCWKGNLKILSHRVFAMVRFAAREIIPKNNKKKRYAWI